MASRVNLVCVALFCAALSAAVVAGDAVEPQGLLSEASGQGEYLADVQGGRKLLNQPTNNHGHPGWVDHDGNVFAFQGNLLSGNTVQVGGDGDQQGASAAVNNAQINKGSSYNGAVWQSNFKSGRKLLVASTTPVWIKDGNVFALQGNVASGNTVQVGDKGDQQGASAAVNNAQTNDHSSYNGAVHQSNSKTTTPIIIGNIPHY